MREFIFSAIFALVCGGYLATVIYRFYRWFSLKNWAQAVVLAASVAIITHVFYSLFGYAWRNVDAYLPEYGRDAHLSALILYCAFFLLTMTLTWCLQASVRKQRESRHSGLSRG
ncbi:MAG: hypothetical protein WCI63_01940 [bacterium]